MTKDTAINEPRELPVEDEAVKWLMTENPVIIEKVKRQIGEAIYGAIDVVPTMMHAVSKILAEMIIDSGQGSIPVTDVIAHVVSGAIRGAAHVGVDARHAAKGIMLGVLYEVEVVGANALDTIRHIARVAIHGSTEVAGDLEATAIGLISGAVHHAKELSVTKEECAAAAADGALCACGSSDAFSAVSRVLDKPIDGIQIAPISISRTDFKIIN